MLDGERAAEERWQADMLARARSSAHPERYELGKPHPDRAKQFKPFAALKGYEQLVAEAIARAERADADGADRER